MLGLALILTGTNLFLYCIMLALLRIETLLRRGADSRPAAAKEE